MIWIWTGSKSCETVWPDLVTWWYMTASEWHFWQYIICYAKSSDRSSAVLYSSSFQTSVINTMSLLALNGWLDERDRLTPRTAHYIWDFLILVARSLEACSPDEIVRRSLALAEKVWSLLLRRRQLNLFPISIFGRNRTRYVEVSFIISY
jgi:hypothetical protein